MLLFCDRIGIDLVDAMRAKMEKNRLKYPADLSRGRRPGFSYAAPPEQAEPLVQHLAKVLRERGLRVATGRFGADMDIELTNRGPFTLVLTSDPWT